LFWLLQHVCFSQLLPLRLLSSLPVVLVVAQLAEPLVVVVQLVVVLAVVLVVVLQACQKPVWAVQATNFVQSKLR
jgi:hypothetical protein